MDTVIKIGREVDGANACHVPSNYIKVSRHHATLYWRNGVATLEDNNSTNGTYVNARRITSCQVTANEMIWLGGNGTDDKCYQLNIRQLLSTFQGSNNNVQRAAYPPPASPEVDHLRGEVRNAQRTDYSMEFDRIKQAYINYHEEVSKLTKKASTKMQLPRILLSSVPALLGVVIMIVSKDMTMRIVAMSAGSVLSGLIGTLTMGRSSSKKEKLTEDMLDLQLKYQKEYRCPKCGKEYSLDLHWKKIKAEGKCPYGCGAQF